MSLLGSLELLAALCAILFQSCHSFAPNEVLALTAFKESIQEDPFSVLSDWNVVDADPCGWSGIQCSPTRDHVIALNLSSLALKGFVVQELGLLTSLQELVLHNNSFIGTIPRKIGMLKSLKVLDFGMNQLSGPIPRELGNLSNVIKLNLQSNGLTGTISPELGYLTNLVELRLEKNKLQGTIPGSSNSINFSTDIRGKYVPQKNDTGFCQLTHLRVADFSDNFFVGIIPSCLKNLPRSSFQQNCFQDKDSKLQHTSKQCGGTVPMKSQPGSKSEKRHAEDVHSARHGSSRPAWLLALEITTGTIVGLLLFVAILTAAKRFKTKPSVIIPWKKTMNGKDHMAISIDDIVGSSETKISCWMILLGHLCIVHARHGSSRPAWLLALEVTTGTIVGLLLFVAILTAAKRFKTKSSVIIPWKKTMNGKDHMAVSINPEILKDVLRISRQELEVVCEDFSNIIGSSPDSVVYKGTMKDGPEIAVISLCISEEQWTSYFEFYFQSEVADLARLNHENTGKLLGYCKENNPFSRMLVFEYASNGTLYEHLHYGEGCQLSWMRRMRIVIGIACGLKYLHTELQPPFTLSELNSSSIYLTEDFSPKLVDFERWKTVLAKSEKSYSGYMSNGTAFRGFRDLLERRHLEVQCNIFAFGVILLEIISGRPPYCKDRGCLVDWARAYLELPEVISNLVDPELKHFRYDDLRLICEVVNLCVQSDPGERPSMHVLTSMLENGIDISTAADLKESPLAWAELALSS